MNWIKTHALILLLAVLATLGPVATTLFFWWRGAEADLRAVNGRLDQVIEAEGRADQAREDLDAIEARVADILDETEAHDAPLPDDVRAALERLRATAAGGTAHP